MKNFIASILFISLLFGCSKIPGMNSKKSSIESKMKTTKSAKELQADITGRWMWQATKGKNLIGMGAFEWEDSNGSIKGVTKSLIPNIKAIPGKGGNDKAVAAIVVFPLSGEKKGNKIKFEVKGDQGQTTKNEGVIKDGVMIKGKSIQSLSEQEKKLVNGKISTIEYEWTAVRLTDSLTLKNEDKK